MDTPGPGGGRRSAGTDYHTPTGDDGPGPSRNGPRRSVGVSNPADRQEILLEDYDQGDAGFNDGDGDDDQVMYPEEDFVPLPLDDDLEDENGTSPRSPQVSHGASDGVKFKTPENPRVDTDAPPHPATPGGTAPATGGTGVENFSAGPQRGQQAGGKIPGVVARKRAPRNRKPATRVINIDDEGYTMLSNENIRRQIQDTSDIVNQRTAGVVHRLANLADDDVPYGADENIDESGGFDVGYYKDGFTFAPPPESDVEAFGILRGTLGGRDPLMGHQMSTRMSEIRARCVETMWRAAGERWGAGYTGGATGEGSVRSRKRGGASVSGNSAGIDGLDYGSSDPGGSSGRGGPSVYDAYDEDGGDDEGGAAQMPSPDADDFAVGGGDDEFGDGSGAPASPAGTFVDEMELGSTRGVGLNYNDPSVGMGMGMDLGGVVKP